MFKYAKKINVAIFTFTCLQSLRMCLSVGKIDMFYETVEFPNKRIILASVALSYKSPQFVFPSEMAWPWWRHQMEAFLCYWPLCGEFTGHRWIPRTKASDRELWCFLLSTPDKNGWVNNRDAGIWDAIGPIMASLQWLCKIFIRKIINGPSSAEFSNIYASFLLYAWVFILGPYPKDFCIPGGCFEELLKIKFANNASMPRVYFRPYFL